jgi:hypothetical protein
MKLKKKIKLVEKKICAEKLYACKVSGRKKYIQVYVEILLDKGCWVQDKKILAF